MREIPCHKCGKVTAKSDGELFERKGSVHFCSQKCAGLDKPKMAMPDIFGDLFGGKFKGGR